MVDSGGDITLKPSLSHSATSRHFSTFCKKTTSLRAVRGREFEQQEAKLKLSFFLSLFSISSSCRPLAALRLRETLITHRTGEPSVHHLLIPARRSVSTKHSSNARQGCRRSETTRRTTKQQRDLPKGPGRKQRAS